MKKKLIITAGSVTAVTGIIVAALAVFYLTQRIDYDITLTGGVQSDTTIHRDDSGVPLINAHSREDICFALGYLHAQDRLIMMEYYRAIANSSAEKVIRNDGAMLDRIVRISGIRRAASEILASLPSTYTDYLYSYAGGINMVRHQLNSAIQKSMLKRDWEPADVIAILLLREWTNAFLNNKELIFPMPSSARNFFLREIIPPGLQYFYNEKNTDGIALLRKMEKILKNSVGPFNRGYALFVPSDKNAGTSDFSAFSFNSSYAIYPDWYPLHIKYGDILIRGITCAGLPFILSGSNQSIGFFGINLDVDTQDFIVEDVKSIKGIVHYRGRRGWKEFIPVSEPLFDGNGPTRHEIVWHTENGPVLNDITGEKNYRDYVITIKHVLPGEDYIRSLFDLPFSENTAKALQKIRNTTSVPKSYLVFKDDRAVTAYTGRFPLRNVSSDVARSEFYFNWRGLLNISAYSRYSRDVTITGSSFTGDLPRIMARYSLPEDTRRRDILSLVDEKKREMSVKSLEEILTDTYSPAAERFTSLFLQNLSMNPVTSARLSRIYFNDWNYRNKSGLVAPTIFYGILLNYIQQTFSDEFGSVADDMISNYHLLLDPFYKLVNTKQSVYFDDIKTNKIETAEEIFDRAFIRSMRLLNRKLGPVMDEWKWGKVHKNHYRVPFKRTLIARLLTGKKPDAPKEGGTTSIFNNSITAELKPESNTSFMGIFSTASSEISMDFSYSVNPMSRFYNNKLSGQHFSSFSSVKPAHTTLIRKKQ